MRYGHVRMTMQGAGVVRMGNPLSGMFPQLPYLAPGSIPASTDGRGAARAPPIKVMRQTHPKVMVQWSNRGAPPELAARQPALAAT